MERTYLSRILVVISEENKVKIYINGKEYESITYTKVLGIERSLIRYRLKSKNYPEYFYI